MKSKQQLLNLAAKIVEAELADIAEGGDDQLQDMIASWAKEFYLAMFKSGDMNEFRSIAEILIEKTAEYDPAKIIKNTAGNLLTASISVGDRIYDEENDEVGTVSYIDYDDIGGKKFRIGYEYMLLERHDFDEPTFKVDMGSTYEDKLWLIRKPDYYYSRD